MESKVSKSDGVSTRLKNFNVDEILKSRSRPEEEHVPSSSPSDREHLSHASHHHPFVTSLRQSSESVDSFLHLPFPSLNPLFGNSRHQQSSTTTSIERVLPSSPFDRSHLLNLHTLRVGSHHLPSQQPLPAFPTGDHHLFSSSLGSQPPIISGMDENKSSL